MALAEIMNLTQNMTSPNAIIQGANVTGYWFEAFLYGMIVIIIFATGELQIYNRFSKRVAVASFLPFVVGTGFFASTLISYTAYFRLIILVIISIIYLYVDEQNIFSQ